MQQQGYLHQIHPVLPVKNVVDALDFYVNRLGFKIGFADEDRPMLRIVTQNIDALYQEYAQMEVFHEHTSLKETPWGTREFAFYDPFKNGLTFYRDL